MSHEPARRRVAGVWTLVAVAFAGVGATRFVGAGLLPATRSLAGDFAAAFPTAYFARLRPDFPTASVYSGWNYGPMLHFVTLPLFLVPRWSMVPAVWAMVNAAAIAISFMLIVRLSGVARQVPAAAWWILAGLWLLYQPLASCFAQGNIEILEMALVLGAVVSLQLQPRRAGVLAASAAMLKFLPIGFLAWMAIRRQWRAVTVSVMTILLIGAVAAVTLRWNNSITLNAMTWAQQAPVAGLHELSVTSAFVHRAGELDHAGPASPGGPRVVWIPSERGRIAALAGTLASALLAAGFAAALFARRARPISSSEIAVLFMTMFMVLPWNHDYYYVFALVPMSLLFLDGVARRDATHVALVLVAYGLISPPVPFGWINQTGWFPLPFAYIVNFYNLPVIGGLTLWCVATVRMMADGSDRVRPVGMRRLAIGAAFLATVSAVGLQLHVHAARNRPPPVVIEVRDFASPPDTTEPRALALSPDGSRVAYVAMRDGVRQICVRAVTESSTTCVAHAADPAGPFFSPDGRSVAFFAGGQLARVPAGGGAVEIVCAAPGGRTGSWGADDTIVFSSPAGIMRVAAAGGEPAIVSARDTASGSAYLSPEILPGGDVVLFTIVPLGGGVVNGTIAAQWVKTGERRLVIKGSHAHYDTATRHLVYARGGRVLAALFDDEEIRVVGPSVPIVDDVLITSDAGAQFAVGANGDLVYASGSTAPAGTLVWVDRQGTSVPLSLPPAAFQTPRLSPDGRIVAVSLRDVTTDLWTYDLTAATFTRLTFHGSANDAPVWLPDSNRVIFTAAGLDVGDPALFVTSLASPGDATLMWRPPTRVRPSSWTPDERTPIGRSLIATELEPSGRGHVWMLTPNPSARRLTDTAFSERGPMFSPDAHWIAYTSDESGQDEVYVQAISHPERKWRISRGGGSEPVWARDGRELFHRNGNRMMAVAVRTSPDFHAASPRELFTGEFAAGAAEANYDVTPDGRRFLMIKPASTANAIQLRLVHGWSARLPPIVLGRFSRVHPH